MSPQKLLGHLLFMISVGYNKPMINRLSVGQLEKLSILFLNLAQGAFLAIIALPLFAKDPAIIDSIKSLTLGIIFTYLSLKTEKTKEVRSL